MCDNQTGVCAGTSRAREMMQRCGETIEFVVGVFVGNTHLVGWRKLEFMIATAAFDQLLV